jgi:metal-responsive CopG/Arc/MetJ family transcriptional regulator
MENARINLIISAKLHMELEKMAEEQGVSRTELIRRALSLMKVAHQARQEGKFVGIADKASKLDTLIVGLD